MRLEGLTEQEIRERALFLEELTARGMRQAVRAVTAELDAETVVLTAASLPGSGVWRALQAVFGVWQRFVNDNIMPYLTQEWRDAGARIAEEIRVEWPDWELPNRGGDLPFESLRHAENHMIGLSTELWENARAALTEGFEAGESVQQLAVRVRGAVDVTEARARAAARTELARAANAGTYDTIVAAGFTGRKEWVATEDSRTRPDHREADGQRVPIGGMFTVGGNLARYPADRMLPPNESVNCRCVAVYDVDDEAIVASLQQFHLPGKHDQKSHGNRTKKTGPAGTRPSAASQPRAGRSFRERLDTAAQGAEALALVPAGLPKRGSLLRAERAALRDYESANFAAINSYLRRGGEPAATGQGRTVAQINAAMDKSPLSADVVGYRGMQQATLLFGDRLDGDLTGFQWRDPAYSSLSASAAVARSFTQGSFGGDNERVLFRVLVPEGTRALQVSGMGLGEQAEILGEAGLRFRVVADRGYSPAGIRELDVEVVRG